MDVLHDKYKLSCMDFSVTFTKQVHQPWQTRYGFGHSNLFSSKEKGLSEAKFGCIAVYKCGHCTEQELRQAKDTMARERASYGSSEESDDDEEEDDDDDEEEDDDDEQGQEQEEASAATANKAPQTPHARLASPGAADVPIEDQAASSSGQTAGMQEAEQAMRDTQGELDALMEKKAELEDRLATQKRIAQRKRTIAELEQENEQRKLRIAALQKSNQEDERSLRKI